MPRAQISESRPILAGLVAKEKLAVIGGRYDLERGVVERLDL